jgi:hypothetical protein
MNFNEVTLSQPDVITSSRAYAQPRPRCSNTFQLSKVGLCWAETCPKEDGMTLVERSVVS